MLRVGLTGGIGAGKSTAARSLAELGAVLVDADAVAREVVEPGTPGLRAVVETFGPEVVAPDGSLDRPALGRLVFADDDKRAALNAIVHPLVYQRRTQLVDAAPADAVVVEDIPLLVENGLGAGFQLVAVVHAPEGERVRRLVADRQMQPDEVRARLRAQADDDARRAAADVWLDNSGHPDQLRAAVDALWHERLVPFEANLRAGRRAPREPTAVLVDPDPAWPAQARRLSERLALAVGQQARRIDHIGSTSVPGLVAKDVVDVQVVVDDVDTAVQVAGSVLAAGLVPMPGEWWDDGRDGTRLPKAMACGADPARAVNCHVRATTSPAWRDALLLRDWLRAHPDEAAAYGDEKRRLAAQPHDSIDAYAESKSPWISAALTRADAWAAHTSWSPS